MKKTKTKDKDYTDIIGKRLNYKFLNIEFKLDEWGEADNYVPIKDKLFLIVEIELSQRHPEMNVLKIWPYLQNHVDVKIMLLQFIKDKKSVSANRIKLCQFVGAKLEEMFTERFRYYLCIQNIENNDYLLIESKVKDLQKST